METKDWWYQLPTPLSSYEINDQGTLRYKADGKLVPTFPYPAYEPEEQLDSLTNDNGGSMGVANAGELVKEYLEWVTYKDHPEYEISKCGLLRMTSDKSPVPMLYTARGTGYYEIAYDKHERPEEFELLTPLDLEVIYTK